MGEEATRHCRCAEYPCPFHFVGSRLCTTIILYDLGNLGCKMLEDNLHVTKLIILLDIYCYFFYNEGNVCSFLILFR